MCRSTWVVRESFCGRRTARPPDRRAEEMAPRLDLLPRAGDGGSGDAESVPGLPAECDVHEGRAAGHRAGLLHRRPRLRLLNARQDVLRLVREFRDRLAVVYGDRLKEVYLYGSCARGEATAHSDTDVAVVLEGPVHRGEEDLRRSGERGRQVLAPNGTNSLVWVASSVT